MAPKGQNKDQGIKRKFQGFPHTEDDMTDAPRASHGPSGIGMVKSREIDQSCVAREALMSIRHEDPTRYQEIMSRSDAGGIEVKKVKGEAAFKTIMDTLKYEQRYEHDVVMKKTAQGTDCHAEQASQGGW